ncbi:hypothetical protein BV25DRAFT_894797 [Artomyces pyxidatus]|uniref:Uncharacterized protein n=1 Tax=Artomyces pyxidatus TaxID=48021 RepID=A0ACB8THM0_9AGAM|nr:hypothetical protein BV25DRAFT_894797 [Artomyces pyxidatus]
MGGKKDPKVPDVLVAVAVLWFQAIAETLVSYIAATLGQYNPDPLHRPNTYAGRTIMWRDDTVTDFRGKTVPAAAERLIRWDRRHPAEIFENGFQPLFAPATPVTSDIQNAFPEETTDLGSYAMNNVPSIFVSTARYYKSKSKKGYTSWQPDNKSNMFEYEIFAYGGIDVNESLGKHPFQQQKEIAFPGGIRSEFIRSAREYDANGVFIRLWRNGRFDPSANGATHVPPVSELPDPFSGPSTSHVTEVWWTSPHNTPPNSPPSTRSGTPDSGNEADLKRDEPGSGKKKKKKAGAKAGGQKKGGAKAHSGKKHAAHDAANAPPLTDDPEQNPDDVMRSSGGPAQDPYMEDVHDVPRPSRACFAVPGVSKQAYFFADTQFIVQSIAGGPEDPSLLNGAKNIISQWPALQQVDFGGVDAVLLNPANPGNEAYFFCKHEYARLNVQPGQTGATVLEGPKSIADNWHALKAAGFGHVDAVLINPHDSTQAYFFHDEHYALIRVSPGTSNDILVDGPKPIAGNWPALTQAGFKHVDMILINPNPIQNQNPSVTEATAYFFSGERYALVSMTPGGTGNAIVGDVQDVAKAWPLLHQATFY